MSLKIRTAKRLHDALTSCNKLVLIAATDAPVQPNGNNTEMLAAERLLEIIGEALKVATRTDPTHVVETIEIRHAISLRNRIAHDYDGIDDQIIWDAVRVNIPDLKQQIEALLKQAPAIQPKVATDY
jgi:uncharacterized protein with HEPN domain